MTNYSFNCKNVKSSIFEINVQCETSDIIVLQETWLNDFDVQFLNTINDNFYAKDISSMDSSTQVLRGRPFEGLGILWKKVT